MAERLKAHVLKTCWVQAHVGSNPTPSAVSCRLINRMVYVTRAQFEDPVMQTNDWGGARVVEWGRLLSGYWGEILSRRFESCPPRHQVKRVQR